MTFPAKPQPFYSSGHVMLVAHPKPPPSAQDLTDELVAFILKQYDEDERIAQEAHRGPWRRDYHGAFMHNITSADGVALITDGLMGSPDVEHVIRHDPASTLADIASKRRIVVEIVDAIAELTSDDDSDRAFKTTLTWILRSLAEPFASRDGYKDTWRL